MTDRGDHRPKVIVMLLSTETRESTCADKIENFPSFTSLLTTALALEEYFCRSLGLSYITLGILTVLLTGNVPLTSTFAESMYTLHPILKLANQPAPQQAQLAQRPTPLTLKLHTPSPRLPSPQLSMPRPPFMPTCNT